MSPYELTKTALLGALEAAGDHYQPCRQRLAHDARSTFTTTNSQAGLLRETLEVKPRIARSRGKSLEGDGELLLALADLGSEPVYGIIVDSNDQYMALYLQASDLKPVGCVLVMDEHPE